MCVLRLPLSSLRRLVLAHAASRSSIIIVDPGAGGEWARRAVPAQQICTVWRAVRAVGMATDDKPGVTTL